MRGVQSFVQMSTRLLCSHHNRGLCEVCVSWLCVLSRKEKERMLSSRHFLYVVLYACRTLKGLSLSLLLSPRVCDKQESKWWQRSAHWINKNTSRSECLILLLSLFYFPSLSLSPLMFRSLLSFCVRFTHRCSWENWFHVHTFSLFACLPSQSWCSFSVNRMKNASNSHIRDHCMYCITVTTNTEKRRRELFRGVGVRNPNENLTWHRRRHNFTHL